MAVRSEGGRSWKRMALSRWGRSGWGPKFRVFFPFPDPFSFFLLFLRYKSFFGCTTFREGGAYFGMQNFFGIQTFFWGIKIFLRYRNFIWDTEHFWDTKHFFCDTETFFGIPNAFFGIQNLFPGNTSFWLTKISKHHTNYKNSKIKEKSIFPTK